MKERFGVKSVIKLIVFIILVGILVLSFLRGRASHRAVAGIGEPIQKEHSGSITLIKNGYTLTVDQVYEYEIEALVVHAHDYLGFSIGDRLAPRDLALAWGKVAEYNDRIDFHWSQANRWYMWQVNSYEELAPVGGESDVSRQSANTHIIPASSSVKWDVMKIMPGDHVRLKGYLVNIDGSKPDGTTFRWNTSTTREDTGDHSCEVFYVTSVEVPD